MATLQQVADAAGVDVATACRILNGKGRQARISAVRIERVLETARRLNFRRNTAARAVVNGRFNAVTLVMSLGETSSTLPMRLQIAIHDALATREMHMIVSRLPDQKLTDAGFVPKLLREYNSDGLLLNYTDHIPEPLVGLIAASRIPSVWLNTRQAADCVHPDDLDAGYRATTYLLTRGHRRIAWVDYSHGQQVINDAHYSARDRLEGYRRAMTEAGLPPRMIRGARSIQPWHREAFSRAWLEREDRPEACVTYSDRALVPIVLASRALGIAPPPMVSFGDGLVRLESLAVPTLQVPLRELGWAAVEMLLEKIAQPEVPLPPRVFPFGLVEPGREGAPGAQPDPPDPVSQETHDGPDMPPPA